MVGITFSETMAGDFSLGATEPDTGEKAGRATGTTLSMQATVLIPDLEGFISDPDHVGELTGTVGFVPLGQGLAATRGLFNLFSPADDPPLRLMIYELAFRVGGREFCLAGRKRVRDDPGFDLWSDTTTLFTTLHEGKDATGPTVGAGILRLSVAELIKMSTTIRAINAGSPTEEAQALLRFGTFFLGNLWATYGKG